jgi:hypothetical protein
MVSGTTAGSTRTSVPSVTVDTSGRPTVSVATALTGALKSGNTAQQQAILTQVAFYTSNITVVPFLSI